MQFNDLLDMTAKLYKNTNYPIALTDAELNVEWANEEALRRFPSLSLSNGVRGFLIGCDYDNVLEKLAEGKPYSTEPFMLYRIEIYPILDSNNLIGCHVFFIVKKSDEGFTDDDVQEKMIATFSNEYKMPLTIIFSTLGLVARYVEGDETMKTYIKLITQNCYRLYRMSNNMSESARFNSGIVKLKLRKGDLCSFIEGLCEAGSILTGAVGIPLEFELPKEKVITSFDPAKLSICFFNFFSNSCKFTAPGNKIMVKFETANGNAIVTVADNGTGISPEVIDRIFEPYFSFDPGGRPYGGGGLGLSIVKSIIALHGGTIAVQSREGEGTRIAFTLPIRVDEELPDYTAESSVDYLTDRFSSLYIELSDVCGSPMP